MKAILWIRLGTTWQGETLSKRPLLNFQSVENITLLSSFDRRGLPGAGPSTSQKVKLVTSIYSDNISPRSSMLRNAPGDFCTKMKAWASQACTSLSEVGRLRAWSLRIKSRSYPATLCSCRCVPWRNCSSWLDVICRQRSLKPPAAFATCANCWHCLSIWSGEMFVWWSSRFICSSL